MIPECETMFEAGVHIGHQLKRWNPKFTPYLYKHIQGVSIIDLEQTHLCLERATRFLTDRIKQGAKVLLVGTKTQAQEPIRELGQATGMPFCANRWLGGCLTNFKTVQASLAKYRRFLDMEASGDLDKMLKKESSVIRRTMAHMHRGFEGILSLEQYPDVLFVVDVLKEHIALNEARRLGIPTVGIVDTNGDPTLLDYPIPANDDSNKSLQLIFECLKEAMLEGMDLNKIARNKLDGKAELGKKAMGAQAKSWERKRPTFGETKVTVQTKEVKAELVVMEEEDEAAPTKEKITTKAASKKAAIKSKAKAKAVKKDTAKAAKSVAKSSAVAKSTASKPAVKKAPAKSSAAKKAPAKKAAAKPASKSAKK